MIGDIESKPAVKSEKAGKQGLSISLFE